MSVEISETIPLVSVLIRSMDRASLSEALASVATQTYQSIEVVLVNAKGDGHTDVGAWCGRFPIRLVRSTRRLNRSEAANLGLEQARGDYLIFLDDDDLFDPDHIASLIRTLTQSPHCKAAFSGVRVTDTAGATLGVYNQIFSSAQLLVGNFLPIHAVLFSRELVMAGCRFDTALETYEDWDFWLQISQRTEFVRTDGVSAVYRSFLGDSGMSRAEDRPLQRERRSVVWRKWWPFWAVENLDLLASRLEIAQEEKEKEAADLRNAFDLQIVANSKLHHDLAALQQSSAAVQQSLGGQVSRLGQTLAELRGFLADRERVLADQDAQIRILNENIQDIYSSTSWKLSAPIRHAGRWVGVLRRKIKAIALLVKLTVHFFRREALGHQIKRAYRFSMQEGWSGVKQLLTRRAPSLPVPMPQPTTQGLDPSPVRRLERHGHRPLASIDTDKYAYFFLDVFDTAVMRLFEKPVDLFKYIGYATRSAGFERTRIHQERKAREKNSACKDIKLTEIYESFHGSDLLRETEAEMTFCVAQPEILAWYADLIAKGKKIYFVSDMYLDRQTIAAILHKNGFVQYEDIFVSSEDDLIKGDGSRFEWLKVALSDSLGNGIHIGDNHVSDWVQPRQHGYDAFQYMESIEFYRYDAFLFSKAPYLVAQDSLGISFALGMFRYWKSGFLGNKPGYWTQFGFFYGGALVAAFCGFVNSTLEKAKLSTSRVFFLARDGDIMSQVYRLLYPESKAVYLLASRRCMSFPSLHTMSSNDDADMLKLFTTSIGITRASDLMDRFGYDDLHAVRDAMNDLESRGLLNSEPDILGCLIDHEDAIMAKASAERDTLLHYLDAVKFFEDPDSVIVDVGWGGTIQNALVKLLAQSGRGDQRLHGIYLGVSDSVEHEDFKTGYLFQGDKSRFAEFLNLIELITSSPKDGVVRVAEVDGNYVPVGAKTSADELNRQAIAVEIQAGILGFAQIVKDRKIGDLNFFQPGDFEALFSALQEHPSQEDVEYLGAVRHAMTLGSHFGEQVLNRKG